MQPCATRADLDEPEDPLEALDLEAPADPDTAPPEPELDLEMR
jgi:hypothetical protein